MWSSPSRYCDTCNLPFIRCASSSSLEKSLYRVISCTKDTAGFFVIHLQPSGSFGLRLGKPLFLCLSEERRCCVTVSCRLVSTSMGAHAELTPCFCKYVRGCLICLQLPKV